MAARKSTAKPVDEAQNIVTEEPTEEEVLQEAQALRLEFHSGRGNEPTKTWDELSEEKKQRWLDKVTGQED